MYILAGNMWFQVLMTQFFFNIDKIVYGLIPAIYDLLITIARTSVFSQSDLEEMSHRIYDLLAIFMIFKVTLSLITYVVNPDDFSDKSKGLSKLGTNSIIVLALLILTPYFFNYAYQIQTYILEDNTIASLIFSEKQTGNEKNNFFNSAGDKMAFVTMSAFFSPNLALRDLYKCSNLTVKVNNTSAYEFNPECKLELMKFTSESGTDYATDIDDITVLNYTTGVENSSFGLIFRKDIALAADKEKDEFIINYKYIFSTVVGVVVILLLVTYCMDVAVRSIKLGFLQLIAPIPIISYIDPKSGKDGLFKKWYQMCFKTFLSLFIRLLALYFAVYIISKVADMKMVDLVDGSYQTNAFVAVFIIIGSLMFAKQLPKMLENLGIKLDGSGFSLNPLKKFSNEALGGKKLLGLGAAAGAAGLAAGTNFASRFANPNNWRNKDGKATLGSILKGAGRTVGSTIGGATGTLKRGTLKAARGEGAGKIFGSSYGEAMNAKLQRDNARLKGGTAFGRIGSNIAKRTGNYDAAQRQTMEYGQIEDNKKTAMAKLKQQKDEVNRRQIKETTKLNEASNLMQRLDSRISNEKGVKDAQKVVDSLLNSGKMYTTAKRGDALTAELNDISKNKMKIQAELETAKTNKNNYANQASTVRQNAMNATSTDEKNRYLNELRQLQEKQKKAEAQEKEYEEQQSKIEQAEKEKEKEIEETKQNNRYDDAVNVMTEEGKAADDALKNSKNETYKKLVEQDEEGQAIINRLEQLKQEIKDTSNYELSYSKSGEFDKSAMYNLEQHINSIKMEYTNELNDIAQREADVETRFEAELESHGLDKESDRWKRNEANSSSNSSK